MTPRILSASAVLGLLVLPLHAWTQPAPDWARTSSTATASAGETTDAGTLRRTISLRELGFPDGLDLSGLSGTRELFFPVPDSADVRTLHLRLPYRSGSAFESRRSLQVEVRDRAMLTTALPTETQTGIIEVPIEPAMIRDGYVPIRLRYSGAISEDRCVDQRVSGAYLAFLPEGGLTMGLSPKAADTVAEVAAVMPRAGSIVLPDRPTEAQAAAALTLAAGNPDAAMARGTPATTEGDWIRSRIELAGASDPSLALVERGGIPALRLGGSDPVATARLLNGRWRALASSGAVANAASATDDAPDRRLTFADLGADTSVQSIADRGTWTLALPITSLPENRRPSALVVDVAVADDGSATPPVVTVLMNGLLLGSAEAERGAMTRLRLDLPEGLTAARNSIEVSVTRQVRAGDCAYSPQGYSAQLLPSSHVVLGEAGSPADFSDLGPQFAGGVTIVVPGAEALPALGRLLGTLIDGETPLRISYRAIPPEGPYVLVASTPPKGSDPPVRFDQGQVRLAGEDGATLIDGAAMQGLTTVQLLRDDDRPILWIRPGGNFAQLAEADINAAGLSRGDVAFFDGDGAILAFSTQRDRLIDIRYPDRTDIADLVRRYHLWLIGAGWLLVSLGFIYLLRRIYQARRTET
ncbi:hypothetical protein B2G71_21945 [Novosphingobium sp. PC22D]|uniref:cellulose biosynthesis cyclic di-GMP-binding regulatory protein BcsB n=1 Tax=Novosphingobium sp. PC22D TaxID=1962403 RepID=UPI000BFAB29B|nr:cellulose biosynthesis cyclic di-GMP-binding regulatory protein BcsB [Novosphingobium sp. PC22D]PEQ10493.1 hypothetical protein B2G71_21945 [Novosphingobium sp. PC22D]